MSSTRVVIFRANTHSFKCWALAISSCQSYLTSSKPSAVSGIVKLVKFALRTRGARSGIGFFGNHDFRSSSLSSTTGGISSSSFSGTASISSSSSSSFSSAPALSNGTSPSPSFFSSSPVAACSPFSSAAFFFSSAAFFAASSAAAFLAALSIFLRSLSNSFCLLSRSFFCFSAALRTLNSLSERSCFAWSIMAWPLSLSSFAGAPMSTTAIFLKRCPLKRFRMSVRSPFIRLLFTSMTTKFRRCSGATAFKMRRIPASSASSCGMPKCMSGLSLLALRWPRRFEMPLFSPQSRSIRSLSSV
mmetsp:Transcript_1782/g.4131  ORF Transcript_1782/g.4131 Transcript_1782/m.4131 type:complete len:302 (+) Transcript_1782:1167-2072(+)